MAENLSINAGSKEEKYRELLPQLYALISTETDFIANLANLSAALKQTFNFFWVGFYLVKGDELVLGPFQGPIACTRIRFGRGVCGTAWKEAHTLIVPDVEQFPGHIACSSDSKSEIVVPMMKEGNVIGVLDIDSNEAREMAKITKGYAYAFQELGVLYFKKKLDELLEDILPKLKAELFAYSYEKIWEEMTAMDRFLAELLVEKEEYKREEVLKLMGDKAGSYSMYRDRLVKRGILNSRQGYISFALPFFAQYIKEYGKYSI